MKITFNCCISYLFVYSGTRKKDPTVERDLRFIKTYINYIDKEYNQVNSVTLSKFLNAKRRGGVICDSGESWCADVKIKRANVIVRFCKMFYPSLEMIYLKPTKNKRHPKDKLEKEQWVKIHKLMTEKAATKAKW